MIEETLWRKKFWDYRLLDADRCTLLFTLDYFERFGKFKEKIGNNPYATKIYENLDPLTPEKWKYWTVMTRLRRIADTLGYRYDLFWNYAFDVVENYDSPYPIPNVFLNEMITQKTVEGVLSDSEFRFARAKFFLPVSYRNKPLQNQYFYFVYDHFRERGVEFLRRLIDGGKIPLDFFTNFKNGKLEGVEMG